MSSEREQKVQTDGPDGQRYIIYELVVNFFSVVEYERKLSARERVGDSDHCQLLVDQKVYSYYSRVPLG